MYAEAAFLAAALPESRVLLHQQLSPYSIGHEMILRRTGSPFLEPPWPAGPELEGKLFTAVFVCCNDYDAAVAGLNNPKLPKTFNAWHKRVGVLSSDQVDSLAISFLGYLRAGRSCPEFQRRFSRRAQPVGAPELLLLLQILGRMGFSRSEAINCPLGLARWHYCAWREQEGGIHIRHEGVGRARAAFKALGWEPMRVQRN